MFGKNKKRRSVMPQKHKSTESRQTVEETPPPPPLSQRTVTVMVQLFEFLMNSDRGWSALDPLLDGDRVHDLLFGMGVNKDFLDKCRWNYYWNFRSLLPALVDGSFFADSAIQRNRYISHGQDYLRVFATALSGMYWHSRDLSSYRDQHEALRSALASDGWRFDGVNLVEIRKATIDEPKEISLVEKLIHNSEHDRTDVLLHHFENGQRLYEDGKYHPCVGEWRSFLEELMRGIWRLTRSKRSEFGTFAERPSISDLFNFLKRAGFFDADEEQAYRSSYGFLSAGGHPGIGEKDDAYLSQILALTFGHALLLKLQSWHSGHYKNF